MPTAVSGCIPPLELEDDDELLPLLPPLPLPPLPLLLLLLTSPLLLLPTSPLLLLLLVEPDPPSPPLELVPSPHPASILIDNTARQVLNKRAFWRI